MSFFSIHIHTDDLYQFVLCVMGGNKHLMFLYKAMNLKKSHS